MKMYKKSGGFSFVETIVVVGIFLLLAGLISPNFFNLITRTSSTVIVEGFVTDLKNQQIKAMVGDTEGRGIPDTYGIYVEPGSYTLFHGQNYDSANPANFEIPIDGQYEIVTTLADDKIVFASGSGEIVGFDNNQNSITIREKRTGQQKVINLNKYGTVTQIN